MDAGSEIEALDEDGWTPLFWAVKVDNVENFQALVAAGADFTAQSESGWTLLHEAARWGQEKPSWRCLQLVYTQT
jgi:ankyrin repeat protein